MARPEPTEFVSFLVDRAGEDLRLVVSYDAETHSVEYASDDVRDRYAGEDVEAALAEGRRIAAPDVPPAAEDRMGDLHCQVLCYDEVAVMLFPTGADAGVLVTLDTGAAQRLHAFAADCQRELGSS